MVAPVASIAGARGGGGRPRSNSEMSGMSGRGDDDFDAVLASLLRPSRLAGGGGAKRGKKGQGQQQQQQEQQAKKDPQSMKLAALTSALIETARERRGEDTSSMDDDDDGWRGSSSSSSARPAELCLAALSALSGSLLSSPSSPEKCDLFYPLLEILRASAPYAARSNPALFASQFGTLARSLGGVATFAGEIGGAKEDNRAGAGAGAVGSNALSRRNCRTASAALTSLLIAARSAKGGVVDARTEKDALTLLRTCILGPFDDNRAKVRREAHGAALKVISSCSSSAAGGRGGASAGAGKLSAAMQHQIVRYAHRVLNAKSSKKKSKQGGGNDSSAGGGEDEAARYGRSMHLLPFLERAGPELSCPKARVDLGEDLIGVALAAVDVAAARSTAIKGVDDGRAVRMCSASLAALVPLIESSSDVSGGGGGGGGKEANEGQRFSSRVLASVLQSCSRVSSIVPSTPAGGPEAAAEIRVLTARLAAACIDDLTEPSSSSDESFQVGVKLLPLTLSAVLGLCDSSRLFALTGSDKKVAGGAEHVMSSGIAAELSRMVRTCLPRIMGGGRGGGEAEAEEASKKCVKGCVHSLEAAAGARHRRHWDAVLPVLAATIVAAAENLDPEASFVEELEDVGAGKAVRTLVDLRAEVEDAPTSREVTSAAAGAVVDGLGIEAFLSLADLEGDPSGNESGGGDDGDNSRHPDGVRDDRAWILRVLPRSPSSPSGGHGRRRTRLAYFRGHILGLARKCDVAAAKAAKKGNKGAAVMRERVVELWGLLPHFCGNPEDLAEALPGLAPVFVKAMGDARYPQLLTIICNSLKTLAAGVRERAVGGDFVQEDNLQGAKTDLAVVSEASTKLLPTLFRIVETLHGTDTSSKASAKKKKDGEGGGDDDEMDVETEADSSQTQQERKAAAEEAARRVPAVTEAIGEMARVCPQQFLSGLFRKVVQRLLAATAETDGDDDDKSGDAEDRICSLLGLAQALVSSESLGEDSVSLLYRSVRPLMRSDGHDTRVQKRAYKVMAEICERHPAFVTAPERLEEMAELLVGSVATCHVSSRHMRLKCMTHVMRGIDSSDPRQTAVIPKVSGEVLLCLKDSNAKTREGAYQLLLAMAEARGDMPEFFKIVAAALAAETPHMRSAAVMAMSRLAFEYAREDESVQALLPSALGAVVVLFDETSREVTKAAVGFLRVCVAAVEPYRLEPLLPDVVGGLMKYGRGKGRFRAKIKIVLKRLARTFGYEKISSLVPETDQRLLTHMRKLAERAERRRTAGKSDGDAGQTVFDDMMESDEEDSDDGRTFLTGATGFTRMTAASGKSLRSAALERARSVAARSAAKTAASARTSATSASVPRIRAEKVGEVLDMLDPTMAKNVHFADEMQDDEFSDDDGGDMDFDDKGRLIVGGDEEDDNAGEEQNIDDDGENDEIRFGNKRQRISKFESAKTAAAEARSRKAQRKRDEPRGLGAAYKSKKAGGDMKKKGQKYEPYAYVPLDGKSYAKKNRGKAVAQMATVVKTKGGGGKRKRR